jgi:DNA-binding MarR family transcriptional regulator
MNKTPQSNENTLEQARFLHASFKLLHERMLKQHGHVAFEGTGLKSELTMTQFTTLTAVRDHGEMSLKEIAEATSVSPPSASNMVDKLVEAGALIREHSKVDRREVRVSVSPQGQEAVETLETTVLESLVEMLDGVGPECAKLWCEVYRNIEQYVLEAEQDTEPANLNNMAETKSAIGAK